MEKRVKIGVIGAGYLGRHHCLNYKELDNAELVWVADKIKERAYEVARECNVKAYEDYREGLAEVEALSIVVPTKAHFEVAKECLEKGKDILLEKPITETLEQAEELILLSKKNGCIFQVGHLERFNPAIKAIEKNLTKPGFIEAHRMGPFKERATDIDVIRDLMIHDLDIILSLVKADVTDVRAMGIAVLSDKIDLANARIEFSNGCVANLTSSRVHLGGDVRKIRIFQPENYISIDYQAQTVAIFSLGEGNGVDPMSRIIIKELKLNKTNALKEELGSFIKSVKDRTEPEVSAEDGKRALEVSLLVHRRIEESLEILVGKRG